MQYSIFLWDLVEKVCVYFNHIQSRNWKGITSNIKVKLSERNCVVIYLPGAWNKGVRLIAALRWDRCERFSSLDSWLVHIVQEQAFVTKYILYLLVSTTACRRQDMFLFKSPYIRNFFLIQLNLCATAQF